ncbi:MAG: HIT domain-containing protein [Caldisericia bacterium]|nr:HIT domain-containing protein [Caldisericia bacterium]MDD4614195.1 HIT domain-containing protein [Caldisericia bacterium]
MKMIWATWRKNYIQKETIPNSECVFCSIAKEDPSDASNLVLYRGVYNYVVMNLYPYTSGHVLIVPYRHVADYRELREKELTEMCLLEQRIISWLEKAFHPQGYNLGVNLCRVAGAGIDSHLHRHVVPRWKGDSNFMTTIGEIRVMSISLKDAYDQIKKQIQEESNEKTI